jgi:hypothetical protein
MRIIGLSLKRFGSKGPTIELHRPFVFLLHHDCKAQDHPSPLR